MKVSLKWRRYEGASFVGFMMYNFVEVDYIYIFIFILIFWSRKCGSKPQYLSQDSDLRCRKARDCSDTPLVMVLTSSIMTKVLTKLLSKTLITVSMSNLHVN
jgi:hypothetical protein